MRHPEPPSRFVAVFGIAFAVSLLLWMGMLTACGGGSSPPATAAPSTVSVGTHWGVLAVDSRIDVKAVRAEVKAAARRIDEQGYTLEADAVSVRLMGDCNGSAGRYLGLGVICVSDTKARALDHELLHHQACGVLRLTGACCYCQDHRGSASGDPDAINDPCARGFNLSCEVQP